MPDSWESGVRANLIPTHTQKNSNFGYRVAGMTADCQESSRRGPIMLVTLKLSLTLYAYADKDAYFLIFVFDGDSKNEDVIFV